MLQAAIYGGISGLALVLGAFVGVYVKLKQKTIAFLMAFGAGILICSLTFGLMEEAFNHGGFDAVIIGFLLGGLAFVGSDYLIHIYGGRKHKKHQIIKPVIVSDGKIITIGAILDGIPESMALGIVLSINQGAGILMLTAIFLSNFPESISSIEGLKKEKFSNKKIILMWLIVGLITMTVTVLSYTFLRDINLNSVGIIESFAAGAILAMLADSIMPEAYDEGDFRIGIITVVGFLLAFILSRFK